MAPLRREIQAGARPPQGRGATEAGAAVHSPGPGQGAARQEGAKAPHASVLLLVENAPVPTDRRVWREALTLQRAGYRVSVICPRGRNTDTEGRECREGVVIYRYPVLFEGKGRLGYLGEYGWAVAASFWFTLRVWWTRGFDVLHVGNPPDVFFVLGWFCKLFGKKFIFDQHDLCPETYLSKFPDARRRMFYRLLLWCERQTYRVADATIVTNLSYSEVARRRGRVPPERLFVVRNGPDLDMFEHVEPDPELKDGFRHLVAFVGVMAEQDGVDYLLRAAHYILHDLRRRDVLFVLVGTGPAWQDLLKLHAELGLEANVRFTGRIPDAPMLRILATADVCASPDPCNPLNDVSTMTKLMEFMAMGKPIVSFDLKEARFSAQEAALYIGDNDWRAFGQAIVDLLDDPERRARLGAIGRERVRTQLAWTHSEPRLRATYAQVLGVQGDG